MRSRRQPRKSGVTDDSGEGQGPGGVPAQIVTHLHRIREPMCHRLCPDLFWNRDISLANDWLRVENESLRDRVRDLEDG